MSFKIIFKFTTGIFVMLLLAGVVMDNHFITSNQIQIKADAKTVYDHLNNLKTWKEWGTWAEDDPSLKVKYSDITVGNGAANSWVGKDGDGRLELTSSDPRKITYDMWFQKNKIKAAGTFIINTTKSGATEVIWNMSGKINTPIIGSYMAQLIKEMNKKYADRSLLNLKKQLESN